jgi:methionine-S-sulfoxide reductase
MKRFAVLIITLLGAITMSNATEKTMTATFAGGCFWCMQPPFENLKGVKSVMAGYTGGHTKNPTYEDVCTGTTGHAESVQVVYDPTQITYNELLDIFWRNIDPTSENSQFADHGTQYRTAIFYHSEQQKHEAEASKDKLAKSGKFKKPIVTEIVAASEFYPAEDYHQHYANKNPLQYRAYKYGSGRADFIEKTWGKSN